MDKVSSSLVFWRTAPLTEPEQLLWNALMASHRASVSRDNASTVALQIAWSGSGDYTKALIGALATLGGRHAPLEDTYALLAEKEPEKIVRSIIQAGKAVPGWGNSFTKNEDQLWFGVGVALEIVAPELAQKIRRVTITLHALGKNIFPNPSAYTAAGAIALGLPAKLSPYIFVAGRLEGWSQTLLGSLK